MAVALQMQKDKNTLRLFFAGEAEGHGTESLPVFRVHGFQKTPDMRPLSLADAVAAENCVRFLNGQCKFFRGCLPGHFHPPMCVTGIPFVSAVPVVSGSVPVPPRFRPVLFGLDQIVQFQNHFPHHIGPVFSQD